MGGYDTSVGTTSQTFNVGGPAGPQLQNDQQFPSVVGALAAINNLGFYGNMRAADPVIDQDVVTLGFLRSLAKPDEESGLYDGATGGQRSGGLYG
jgi:hypothetical protein